MPILRNSCTDPHQARAQSRKPIGNPRPTLLVAIRTQAGERALAPDLDATSDPAHACDNAVRHTMRASIHASHHSTGGKARETRTGARAYTRTHARTRTHTQHAPPAGHTPTLTSPPYSVPFRHNSSTLLLQTFDKAPPAFWHAQVYQPLFRSCELSSRVCFPPNTKPTKKSCRPRRRGFVHTHPYARFHPRCFCPSSTIEPTFTFTRPSPPQ